MYLNMNPNNPEINLKIVSPTTIQFIYVRGGLFVLICDVNLLIIFQKTGFKWGAITQSVERMTPGEEVSGSIHAVATRSLLVGSMSV